MGLLLRSPGGRPADALALWLGVCLCLALVLILFLGIWLHRVLSVRIAFLAGADDLELTQGFPHFREGPLRRLCEVMALKLAFASFKDVVDLVRGTTRETRRVFPIRNITRIDSQLNVWHTQGEDGYTRHETRDLRITDRSGRVFELSRWLVPGVKVPREVIRIAQLLREETGSGGDDLVSGDDPCA
jgi:hypothetical protein